MKRSGFVRAAAALLALAPPAAAAQAPTPAPAAAERAASPGAPIPVERFAELPFFDSPVLSPDGTRIAAKITDGGEDRIGIWTVGAQGARSPSGSSPRPGSLPSNGRATTGCW